MSTKENPLVSICIPTYNGETYLEEALLSAINQSYKNIEIIISDDNSKDKTLEIVNLIKLKTDVPIHVFNHDPNGIGANWNYSVTKANGEYIKFLFQDDLLEKTCIEDLLQPFLNNKKIGISFCRRKILMESEDESNLEWIKNLKELHIHWKNLNPQQKGKALLKDKNFLAHPKNKVGEPTAVLLKKEVFDKIGYFRTDLKQSLDYEYWYRVFKKYDVGFVDKELISFRLHNEQATAKNNNNQIKDYTLYPVLIYKHFFWYLHPSLRKELFFRYNRIGKLLNKNTK